MNKLISTALLFFTSVLPGLIAAPVLQITVGSSEFDRPASPVAFALRGKADATRLVARTKDGIPLRLQIDGDRNAWLLLPPASKNEITEIELFAEEAPSVGSVIEARRVGHKVEFWQGRRRLLDYQAEPGEFPREGISEAYRRGGYLHPVWSPDGVPVTDDFPADHVHHHGIWFPWTKTRFEGREPDFWNMGAEKGRVEFVALDGYAGGMVFGQLDARHQFVDLITPGGKVALEERWTLRVFASEPGPHMMNTFDLESVQTCATDQPLILPEYHYGGLGFRGNWDWNGADHTDFLTSNGETDRVKGHATRANWCYIGGVTGGKRAGIVILCHPDNFRAPQPMRIHPTEPFFCFAPQQLGEMTIEPGKPYVSKYRFLVLDGEPDVALIENQWQAYAHPPVIRIH